MKQRMKKWLSHFSGTFALVLLSVAAMAQNAVTGKVTDSKDGSPVPGVTVTVKGTKISSQTGSDGVYKINAANGATLVFTSVGFTRKEVVVSGPVADVSFVASSQQLNEVVVVGYGTTRKKDLTGSVAVISAKDFNKGAITTPDQLIVGKIAGVSVVSNGGGVGTGSTIRIRGGASLSASNDPLIVLDGVPLENSGAKGSPSILSTINPNDIESFNVLKDASATAIYGARASNGVIIISTKKGKRGKMQINFNSQVSVASLIKQADVLTADEFRTLVNKYGAPATAGATDFRAMMGNANTNWQDQIYRTAVGTDNNLSLSGSAGKVMPYRVSFGYTNQEGILKDNKIERGSIAVNLSPKFWNDHISVNLNLKGSNTFSKYAADGVIGSALSFDPTQPIYSKTNRYGGYYQYLDASSPDGLKVGRVSNPVAMLNQIKHSASTERSVGNIQIDYKFHFLPELHANVNLGYDASRGTEYYFTSDSSANDYKYAQGNRVIKGTDTSYHGGNNSIGKQKKLNTTLEAYLNYVKDIKSIHSRIDVVAGYGYQEYKTRDYNYVGRKLDGTVLPGTNYPAFPYGEYISRLISFYGRLNYGYKNRYLLTATLRDDGSSKFIKDKRWGIFPSLAFAWKAKDESFLRNSKVFSDLKLRLGYGVTGQQDGIPGNVYTANYSLGSNNSLYQFGNTFVAPLRPDGYNVNLKWEETTTSNIGIDFGFFNNRLTGSIDGYIKKTKDLLNNEVNQSAGTNFTNKIAANIGEMENKGVELTLNYTPVHKNDLTVELGFNATYNENKITRLTFVDDPKYLGVQYNAGASLPGTGANLFIHSVGYQRGSFFVYQQVYDANGNPIEDLFADRNRDGIINEKDQYRYKNADPKLFLGFSPSVTYKKWNAGFVMRASIGNYVYDNIGSNTGRMSTIMSTYNGGILSNGSANVLETNFSGKSDQYFLSDYYVKNASFLKMDNFNIGYNFGRVLNNKANLRISGTVQNVFIVTKFKGIDPEQASGVDNNTYPRPRTYVVGVNLDF